MSKVVLPAQIGGWCPNCGARHGTTICCPSIEVTGPEKPRWRVAVETVEGIRGYGVLVARADEHWRARIVTFPNILWMVPGGGETMKFYGRTEEQARRLAADFVREHCVEKGYLMRDEVEFAGKLHRPGISDFGATGSRSTVAAPRYGRRLPVRFGVSVPTHMGYTANLSETGLFIATPNPPGSGASLGLSLELEHCKVPLRGSVAWQRDAGSPVGEHGMGMKLVAPPPIYVSYVRALA